MRAGTIDCTVIGMCIVATISCNSSPTADDCFSDTEFPESRIEQWSGAEAGSRGLASKEWELHLRKSTDTCGSSSASLSTVVIIHAPDLLDPEEPSSVSIDVPVVITKPGDPNRPLFGHQYTPERMRTQGVDLTPSYLYASTGYLPAQSGEYHSCPSAAFIRRELESLQFTGMTRRSVPAVRMSFVKNVYSVDPKLQGLECVVDGGQLNPRCNGIDIALSCEVTYRGYAVQISE
jgi:hypothetical protein